MKMAVESRESRKIHGRRMMPMLVVLAGLLVLAGSGGAQAGGRKSEWGYSGIHGPLYPGKVIVGDPGMLPPTWRAYPLSIMTGIFVIQPDRRKIRTNFTARKHQRVRR